MKFNSIQYIDNGGWHFTNFKTFDELEKKLTTLDTTWNINRVV